MPSFKLPGAPGVPPPPPAPPASPPQLPKESSFVITSPRWGRHPAQSDKAGPRLPATVPSCSHPCSHCQRAGEQIQAQIKNKKEESGGNFLSCSFSFQTCFLSLLAHCGRPMLEGKRRSGNSLTFCFASLYPLKPYSCLG